MGEILDPTCRFNRAKLSPDIKIAKIRVKYNSNRIGGLQLFDKDDYCVLEAGHQKYPEREDIYLYEGERLLGIRSTTWGSDKPAHHSNMTFILGRSK